jgi:hypothetical protein
MFSKLARGKNCLGCNRVVCDVILREGFSEGRGEIDFCESTCLFHAGMSELGH